MLFKLIHNEPEQQKIFFLHHLCQIVSQYPDSELIQESVCACAKLFVDDHEESTWHKSNHGIEQKHRRILYENDTKLLI
jgi:hypothetical protein